MRHLRKGRKFGRVANQRRAFIKTMAASFFISGHIRTTEARARELRPLVEKFLTRAKNPTLANRRQIRLFFSEPTTARIVTIAGSLGSRQGGYTRITKMGMRTRDSAKMAMLELVR